MTSLLSKSWLPAALFGAVACFFLATVILPADLALPFAYGLCALSVVVTFRNPVAGCSLFVLIFAMAVVEPSLRSFGVVFGSFVAIGITSFVGRYWLAVITSVLLAVIGNIRFNESFELSPDPVAFGLVSFLMLASGLTGAFVGIRERKFREEEQRAQHCEIVRKKAAVRTLHDSVASSLTSVVMRAETLKLDPCLREEHHDIVSAISEDTRKAMEEVRQLIRKLNDDEWSISAEPLVEGDDPVEEFINYISGHGFTVNVRDSDGVLADLPRRLPEAGLLLRELATNLIKYANPHYDVELCATNGQGQDFAFTMTNECLDKQTQIHLSTGLGLQELEHIVARSGGKLIYWHTGTRWHTKVTLFDGD